MAMRTDTFDLGALRLSAGEGRRLELGVVIDPFELGGHRYSVTRPPRSDSAGSDGAGSDSAGSDGAGSDGAPAELLDATLNISRMTGQGYALALAFAAMLSGPCMRCLEPAAPSFAVDAREVSMPGEGEELESPYLLEATLDISGWARDALALALPPALLCRPDCLGLCPVCGADLNTAGPEHAHEAERDPRWAALSELEFGPPETGVEASPAED